MLQQTPSLCFLAAHHLFVVHIQHFTYRAAHSEPITYRQTQPGTAGYLQRLPPRRSPSSALGVGACPIDRHLLFVICFAVVASS
jgi:hypothetical protein